MSRGFKYGSVTNGSGSSSKSVKVSRKPRKFVVSDGVKRSREGDKGGGEGKEREGSMANASKDIFSVGWNTQGACRTEIEMALRRRTNRYQPSELTVELTPYMSAVDDTPAQGTAAPPSIDTQQLQQLQPNPDPVQSPLQPQQPPQPVGSESARKRTFFLSKKIYLLKMITYPATYPHLLQPKHPQSGGLASLVTPEKQGAARFCPARHVHSFFFSSPPRI
jgi:hypothetical protein